MAKRNYTEADRSMMGQVLVQFCDRHEINEPRIRDIVAVVILELFDGGRRSESQLLDRLESLKHGFMPQPES